MRWPSFLGQRAGVGGILTMTGHHPFHLCIGAHLNRHCVAVQAARMRDLSMKVEDAKKNLQVLPAPSHPYAPRVCETTAITNLLRRVETQTQGKGLAAHRPQALGDVSRVAPFVPWLCFRRGLLAANRVDTASL